MAPKSRAQMADLKCGPPRNFHEMDLRTLFAWLLESGGWTYEGLIELVGDRFEDDDFLRRHEISRREAPYLDLENAKNWGLRNTIPQGVTREALLEVLKIKGGEFGPAWIAAFIELWTNTRLARRDTRKTDAPRRKRIENLQAHCLMDPQLTRLPSLFGTEQSLPVASAYVDLAVSAAALTGFAPDRLQAALSLSERINQRIERRYASKRSPQEIFDLDSMETGLILGDPGSGKSSLLKRIALDIAEGAWSHSQVPLLVEAREYWRVRQAGVATSLLDHAMSRLEGLDEDLRALLLEREDAARRPAGILLIDGLDEIANTPEAVQLVYSELKALSVKLPWIATCRPTGLVSSLSESLRCNICDLDDEAIESLVRNWCETVSQDGFEISAETLLPDLFGSSSNREMARNPFLLTALCFLKSEAPAEDLPTARIDVYSQLIERIGEQARGDTLDPAVMGEEASQALETFCFHLYDALKTRQVFSQDDWNAFFQNYPGPKADLERQILPTRLLTAWKVGVKRFHFLHLSLQEFLIAKALLNKPPSLAMSKRFSPAWRPVFRFYAALLIASGREEEFRALVRVLFREQDFSGFSLLTLAEIFSDAGIRAESAEWLGEDLRARLHGAAMSGDEIASEALFDALALLDPDWLTEKTLEQNRSRLMRKARGELVMDGVMVGPSLDSPYEKLARARTPLACRTIRETFLDDDHTEAMTAAFAFAVIATPSDRKAVVERVLNADEHDEFASRFIALAEAARRVEFLPALERILGWTQEEGGVDYGECLQVIANIGGGDAARMLEQALRFEADRMSGDFNAFEQVQDCVIRMGGSEARAILERIGDHPNLAHWRQSLRIGALGTGAADLAMVDALLSDPICRDDAISALSDAATYGRPVSDEICARVAEAIIDSDSVDVMNIALLEGARLDNGQKPILCTLLVDRARDLLARLRDEDDPNDRNFLLGNFQLALDTLGRAPWLPARDLVRELLYDVDLPEDILLSAVELCGKVYRDSGDTGLLSWLLDLWFEADGEMSQSIALAVGQIDLDTLFTYQSAEGAFYALEQIAAERDLLIFDDFHANRQGDCIPWRSPPRPLLYLFDPDVHDTIDLFAHLLSTRGFSMAPRDTDACEAVLVFGSLAGDELEMLNAFRAAQGGVRPVIEIPLGLEDGEVRSFVETIVEQLSAKAQD